MTSECPRCEKTKQFYRERFGLELRLAQGEVARLSAMFKDVCWYNFETRARVWEHPWRVTDEKSYVRLMGMSFGVVWRRGNLHEHGKFPVWFEGKVRDAPPLPPEIILNELRDAQLYVQRCEEQARAPDDFAPGGAAYNALLRTTLVPVRVRGASECLFQRKRKLSDERSGGNGGHVGPGGGRRVVE